MGHIYEKRNTVPSSVDVSKSAAQAAPSASEMLHLSNAGAPQPMSPELREKFEPGFSADFSNIRISRGHIPDSMGVEAVAKGTDILLDSRAGMDVLGHELAHVVQQASGKVAGGFPVVHDAGLEHQADVQGARVASGMSADMGGFGGEMTSIAPMSAASAPAQCKSKEEKNEEKLAKTKVPSRVAQQGKFTGFSEETRNNMSTRNDGIRADGTSSKVLAPVNVAVKDEIRDYYDQLDKSGFDYDLASKGGKELTWEGSAAKIKYSPQSVKVAQQLMPIMEAHLSGGEGAKALKETYKYTMQNPGKMRGDNDTFNQMEGKVLSDIMSRGFNPTPALRGEVDKQGKRKVKAGSGKDVLMDQTSTQLVYLERLLSHADDEDFPEELKPLVEQFQGMRSRLSDIGRSGLSEDERTTLDQQYGGGTALLQRQPQQQVAQPTPTISPKPGQQYVRPQDLPQSGPGWEHTGSTKIHGRMGVYDDPSLDTPMQDLMPSLRPELSNPTVAPAKKKKSWWPFSKKK